MLRLGPATLGHTLNIVRRRPWPRVGHHRTTGTAGALRAAPCRCAPSLSCRIDPSGLSTSDVRATGLPARPRMPERTPTGGSLLRGPPVGRPRQRRAQRLGRPPSRFVGAPDTGECVTALRELQAGGPGRALPPRGAWTFPRRRSGPPPRRPRLTPCLLEDERRFDASRRARAGEDFAAGQPRRKQAVSVSCPCRTGLSQLNRTYYRSS